MLGGGNKSLSEGPFGNNLWMLHVIVLVLACCSLYQAWYHIYKMGVMYMHARAARSKSLYRRKFVYSRLLFIYLTPIYLVRQMMTSTRLGKSSLLPRK